MNLTKESKQVRFNFTTLNYKTVKGWDTLNNLLNRKSKTTIVMNLE